MSTTHSSRRLFASSFLVVTALTSGCATTAGPSAPPPIEKAAPDPDFQEQELIPVVRNGRYTLVELLPTVAQRDLLLQVVELSVPEDARATVGDGLRHALKRSGYQLCETARAVIELYSLPLPAAHLQLGPMTLRDTLLTLAGPAWDLHADDGARQVCFVRFGAGQTATVEDSPAAEGVQVFPVTGDQP